MTKHVFEVGSYGYCAHRGEYIGETESMIKFAQIWREKRTERKALKKNHLVLDVDDPNAAVGRCELARRAFNAEIDSLQNKITALKASQKEAVIAALKGEA